MTGNTNSIHRGRWTGRRRGLIELILCLVILGDIIVFWWATDRPQGLAPADPADRRQLVSTPREAGSRAITGFTSDGRAILLPAMTVTATRSSGSDKYAVRGFSRRAGWLYLNVRLYESLDLSLRKGWGKNFLLVDTAGKKYLYDPTRLPNAVEIHDTFVDLPNDLRARQTVPADGYRDLILEFPGFPGGATPDRLQALEYFVGNSPANPGITYDEVKITATGEIKNLAAIAAAAPGEKGFRGDAVAGDGASFHVQQVLVDPSAQWQVTLAMKAPRRDVITINNALLVDANGAGYNYIQTEDIYRVNLDQDGRGTFKLAFEPLPETAAAGLSIWLNYTTAAGEVMAVQIPLGAGV